MRVVMSMVVPESRIRNLRGGALPDADLALLRAHVGRDDEEIAHTLFSASLDYKTVIVLSACGRGTRAILAPVVSYLKDPT